MKLRAFVLLLAVCAVLCNPATAATAQDFTLKSNTDWLVAGEGDATISAALNGSVPGVTISQVIFSVLIHRSVMWISRL